MKNNFFWNLGFETIKELENEQGILASGREEIYGCIFGRDSLITSLKLLDLYDTMHKEYFFPLVKKVLHHLCELQGKEVNIESGEEPGKCIHEYRPERHEHLTQKKEQPWYLYPDNIMRNFDSVDATPLFLITMHRYWQKSGDEEFIRMHTRHVEAALRWILLYGDTNKDGFVDYEFSKQRHFGGLVTQSWMDSAESVFHESGEPVVYPVAPVEVQAYVYEALRLWADYYDSRHPEFAQELTTHADQLKVQFNALFLVSENDNIAFACAIDGAGKPLLSVRSSIGHILWSSTYTEKNKERDCILYSEYVPRLVERLMAHDMFEPEAGIRTLSKTSRCFAYNSYHNGSIWPHDNGLIIEGFERFGYTEQARQVRRALSKAFSHFQTPIELFVFTDKNIYEFFTSPTGQMSCKKQAWSAATMLKVSRYMDSDGIEKEPGV